MTRTALRHTLSAFTGLALVSIAASSAVAGETMDKMMRVQHMHDELISGIKGHTVKKPETEGLATQTPSQQAPSTHYQFRWWHDYSSR